MDWHSTFFFLTSSLLAFLSHHHHFKNTTPQIVLYKKLHANERVISIFNKGLRMGPSLSLSKRTAKYWFDFDLWQTRRAFPGHTWLSDSKSHATKPPCHDFAWSYLATCHRIATPRLCMVIPVNLPYHHTMAPPVCQLAQIQWTDRQTDTHTHTHTHTHVRACAH